MISVLGISALYHDSAACIIQNGHIIAAAQEERFTRKKHDSRLPINAIEYCLKQGNISIGDIDYIVYYDNPILTLDRYMHNLIAVREDCCDLVNNEAHKMFSSKLWVKKLLLDQYPEIQEKGKTRFFVTKHHISHAASAYYPSPYDKAIIITNDGVGEWTTLSIGVGNGKNIEIKQEIRYPHSLGLFYSAFTYYCGFKVNSGDYKFMGLAPYGTPKYYNLIRDNIIDIKNDGSFRLNLSFFDFQHGRTMINNKKMEELFGGKRRLPESEITKREMDIAASVQMVTEEVILKIANHAKKAYGEKIENLCLAGGVALNCVANGKLSASNIFKNIWVQPAAGDAGGALGAALYAYYMLTDAKRVFNTDTTKDIQKNSFLGPEYSNQEILDFLLSINASFHTPESIYDKIADKLVEQKVIGVFQGRMEYGPRALGHRSIIADPRSEIMQSKLNLKIKHRESFRPFAPAVLEEDAHKYFEIQSTSPYMLFCAPVEHERRLAFQLNTLLEDNNMNMLPVVNSKRSDIPAVTHVDYSARIQTVNMQDNPEFATILEKFKEKSGCGVLVNTSFNVRGEPIVCSLMDAYKCFMFTDMDVLVLGKYILYKEEQKYNEAVCGKEVIYEAD